MSVPVMSERGRVEGSRHLLECMRRDVLAGLSVIEHHPMMDHA
jgi:hypothetical protein